MRKVLRGKLLPFVVLSIISIPAILPFLHSGFPVTDDGNWMIIRLSAFYEALKDGQFPVRWLGRLNNGYGYPASNFLYPGFLYLGVPLAVVTSSFVISVKLLFISSLFMSAVGMYLWLRTRFSLSASLYGAAIYLYAPYHIYDATRRGSLGEVLFLGILPFVFWALERKSRFLSGLFLGLLLLSHNSLAALFLPLIVFYTYLITRDDKSSFLQTWGGVISGILLSLFFWVPALHDLSYTVFQTVSVSEWREYFATLPMIGWGAFIIFILAVFLLSKNKKKDETTVLIVIFFLIIGLISLFLSSSYSSVIWEFSPVGFIQFPFRLLSVVIVACALLSAWILSTLKRNVSTIGIILVSITLATTLPYLTVHDYEYHEEGFYATNMDTTTVKNEYMPKWVKQPLGQYQEKKVLADNVTISDEVIKDHSISFHTSATNSAQVMINQVYFPGWEVQLDSKKISLDITPDGLMSFSSPKGEHQVQVIFKETPLRLAANSLSLLGLGLIIIFGIQSRRRSN